MDFLKRRLCDDRWNIQLRCYSLIEEILNEKWIELFQTLEETPFEHSHLIEFVFKFIPSTMIEQINQFKERRLKSIDMFKKKKSSFQIYRNERKDSSSSSSSSSSSLISIESFDQSILFVSQAKLYEKCFHWKELGHGECEILRNNCTREIYMRFWSWNNQSIKLLLLVNLHWKKNFSLLSKNLSSLIIQFQSTNQCDYPLENILHFYQLKFYCRMDVIRLGEVLHSLEE